MAGTGGACPKSLTSCSGACVDTGDDGKHCGECGHDCLGGSCMRGVCQPTLTAQYLGRPHSISVEGTHVCYKSTSTHIGCAKKDGSDLKPFEYPSATAAAYSGAPMEVDSGTIFFVWAAPEMPFRLTRCSLSTCDATTVPFGGDYSWNMAVDSTERRLVWWEPDGFWTSPTIAPFSATKIAVTALPAGSPRAFAYRRGNIYFPANSGTHRVPIGTTGVPAAPVFLSSLQAIAAINDDSLFLLDGNRIRAVPLPNGLGGTANVIVESVDSFVENGMAADARSLYWIQGRSKIERCEIADCAVSRRVLPVGETDVVSVRLDESAIYYVTQVEVEVEPGRLLAGGKVWRLAK